MPGRPVGSPARRIVAFLVVLVLLGAGAAGIVFWPRLRDRSLAGARDAYQRRDWPAAASAAAEALRRAPTDPERQRLLARALGRAGHHDEARTIYERLGLAAMGAEDFVVVGQGLALTGRNDQARQVFEMALEKDAKHPEALDALGRFYAALDRLADAADLAVRLEQVPGWEVRGALMRGLVLEELSDPAGAAAAIERALGLDPSLELASQSPAAVRKVLSRALLQAGKPQEAERQLRIVLSQGNDPEAFWLLSRALLAQPGDHLDAAVSALQQANGYGDLGPTAHEPAPYAGAASCAKCHASILRSQQTSRHARTIRRAEGALDFPVPDAPIVDPGDPTTTHTIHRDGDVLRWESRSKGRVVAAVVDYLFGSGDRGVTPVGHDDAGHPVELRLSHYKELDGWDITTGQPKHPEHSGPSVGEPLRPDSVRHCLACHTTNWRASRDPKQPVSADHGIGCERCHGPAGLHARAMEIGFPEPAIARLQLADTEAIMRLCSNCHAPSTTVSRTDPRSVRFQGTTLTWSRCYTQSGGGMSCLSCHDPHHDASSEPAFYEAQCLACHSADAVRPPRATPRAVLGDGRPRTPCPVNPREGCVSCHMPTQRTAVPHTAFTDHFIRIHKPDEATATPERPGD